MDQKQPGLTVDCVVFDSSNRLLLIRRKNPPFQGQYAFPGGFVEYGETTEHAALRELREETGLTAGFLKLVGVYSEPNRDPRRHIVSVAYLIEVPKGAELKAGDDAASAKFITHWQDLPLAFDHNKILNDALLKKNRI